MVQPLPRLSIVLGLSCLCITPSLAQLGLLGRLQPIDYSKTASANAGGNSPTNGDPILPSILRTTPPATESAVVTDGTGGASQPGSTGFSPAATAAAQDSPLLHGLRDSSVFSGDSTGRALPGTSRSPALRGGPTGDCAEPSRVNLDVSLAEEADIVITGMVVASGPASIICAPTNSTLELLQRAKSMSPVSWSGPDLLVDYAKLKAPAATNTVNATSQGEEEGADGKQDVILVAVQCVHKGALACRRNSVDAKSGISRCVVAVKVPPQPKPDDKTLPPCSLTNGFRYMMLLSSKAAAACDGAYTIAHPRIVDSMRPHLGVASCPPYPRWPSQNTNADGQGLAALLSAKCPGAAYPKPANCSSSEDPCKDAQCPKGAAITCVPKACEGRYMATTTLLPAKACTAAFISQETGLPVSSCDITAQQLNRQARQSLKRLDLAAGKTNAEVRGIGADGMPHLINPDRLFPNRFGISALGGGDSKAAQAVGADTSSGSSIGRGQAVDGAAEDTAADNAMEGP